jgi:hypothetical protein
LACGDGANATRCATSIDAEQHLAEHILGTYVAEGSSRAIVDAVFDSMN